jgi:ribonuclease D
MTTAPINQHELILTNERFAEIADVISRHPSVGLDLEGNGRHRYPESVCLVQISIPESNYIVDPLAVDDMSPLSAFLADDRIEKILHSADYDVRCLDRDWGFRIRNLFDTSIGASLLGLPKTGLGSVLENVLGVDIPKSKRLQKSDWTIRPLGDEALDYAASDVAYLHELRDAMHERLTELGRMSWMEEECERQLGVRFEAPDPERAFLNVKGNHALDGQGLAILRELVAMRERHALNRGRPHFRVMSNETMVALSAKPEADLRKMVGLGPFGRRPLLDELRQTLKQGLESPPYQRPPSPRRPRMAAAEKKRLDALKAWRKAQGEELKIDPSLIWPMPSLERLAWEPGTLDAETDAKEVRRWQVAEFVRSLRKVTSDL